MTRVGYSFLDVQVLPTTGTYTLLIDVDRDATGTQSVSLYSVPADASASIAIGGAPVALTTTTPGQNARYTFSGTAGQRISVVTTADLPTAEVSVLKPDGTVLAIGSGFTYANGPWEDFVDVQTLPVTGTYTVLVDGQGPFTGTVTVQVYSVPADPTGSATVNGATATVTITAPGQNARVTFHGNRNQSVTITVSPSMVSVQASLLRPDGTTLYGPLSGTSPNFSLPPQLLPTNGTYTVVLDPSWTLTGSLSVQVTSP